MLHMKIPARFTSQQVPVHVPYWPDKLHRLIIHKDVKNSIDFSSTLQITTDRVRENSFPKPKWQYYPSNHFLEITKSSVLGSFPFSQTSQNQLTGHHKHPGILDSWLPHLLWEDIRLKLGHKSDTRTLGLHGWSQEAKLIERHFCLKVKSWWNFCWCTKKMRRLVGFVFFLETWFVDGGFLFHKLMLWCFQVRSFG